LIRYLDTSLLIAAFTNEAGTDDAQGWLDKQKLNTLAISEWVVTEFSAALSIKLRLRHLTSSHRAAALAMFAVMAERSFIMLPILSSHFRRAARIADQYALGLRAGDALHVAIAFDHGATLCTLDERLSQAGPAIGIRTLLLSWSLSVPT
jgi:predicted nucleic acid-binding protein